MRAIGIAIVSALATSAIAADTSWHPIDLDRPGALEQLKQEHPEHYRVIAGILRSAETVPCKPRELRTLKSRFDMEEMACNIAMMTSYPPKRHLSFAWGGATYTATVTMTDGEGHLLPANGEERR
jgi:hypothetical protein